MSKSIARSPTGAFHSGCKAVLLVAGVVAVGGVSAGAGHAMLLPVDNPVLVTPAKISLTVPSGGPATRAGHLALVKSSPYLLKTSVVSPRSRDHSNRGTLPGKVAWLVGLLVSMCGSTLYFGRQLSGSTGMSTRYRAMRRA